MCRMLYIKSNVEINLYDYLNHFAKMCKESKEYQGHGWGCTYFINGKWHKYKNILPIWEDDLTQFDMVTKILVHARSAFQDKDIVVENNMPFYNDDLTFAFNGELNGVKIKEDGRIGAEKIFNFIKRFHIKEDSSGLEKAIKIIIKRTKYVRALNVILLDEEKAFISSNYNEDPDYFQMWRTDEQDKLIVCSQPFGDFNWNRINNNTTEELK